MKGKFTLKILEKIGAVAVSAADLLEAFLESGYGASAGKVERSLAKIKNRRENRDEYIKWQRRYYNILGWLKQDGLVVESGRGKGGFLKLTRKGYRKWQELIKREKDCLPLVSYKTSTSEKFLIVIFDIPESEKRKRQWLRAVLKSLGFRMLQESVWGGKVLIPKELINNLHDLKILDFVEIFEITKSGSLKRLSAQ